MDGGIASDLLLQAAIDRGADEIFALYIAQMPPDGGAQLPQGMLAISGQALATIIDRTADLEIQAIHSRPDVRLHLIRLWSPVDAGFWNFTYAQELIADGRRCAERVLDEESHRSAWDLRWEHWLQRLRGVRPRRDRRQK